MDERNQVDHTVETDSFIKKRNNKKSTVYVAIGVVIGIVISIIFSLISGFLFDPSLILKGEDTIIISVGGEYTEPGYTLVVNNKTRPDLLSGIRTNSHIVDTGVVGEYIVTYEYLGRELSRRTVKVVAPEPKKLFSIPLNPAIDFSFGSDSLSFKEISVYEFVADDDSTLEDCVVMRQWNNMESYYSCGKPGEKVLTVEGDYLNTSTISQNIIPGQFVILANDGTILEPNFTTKNTISVEPNVLYNVKVPFENYKLIPNIFTLKYAHQSEQREITIDLERRVVLESEPGKQGVPGTDNKTITVELPESLFKNDYSNRAMCEGEWENIVVSMPFAAKNASMTLLSDASGGSGIGIYRFNTRADKSTEMEDVTFRWQVGKHTSGFVQEGTQYRLKFGGVFIDGYQDSSQKNYFESVTDPFIILDCGY